MATRIQVLFEWQLRYRNADPDGHGTEGIHAGIDASPAQLEGRASPQSFRSRRYPRGTGRISRLSVDELYSIVPAMRLSTTCPEVTVGVCSIPVVIAASSSLASRPILMGRPQ